ncbi:hypothetical protein GCM10009630_34520 [Kribbella jejuensis]|uniref:Uncharacterized protein n=1 Tax=Kribbella jejuensis TaxID=236068 RepID=A0A542DSZ9_9ACTN|nr:lysozyme [Kribbella jejuensis]TQJ06210.1 hypothetical protein FB475_5865 [Kribbella jejuensis]
MRKASLVVAATAAIVLGGAGLAYAAIPDSGGVIHACYGKTGGTLRVSDTGTCRSTEVSLSWNTAGPAAVWSGLCWSPAEATWRERRTALSSSGWVSSAACYSQPCSRL